jgi:PAS domain S-box-containing protein
VLTQFDSLPNVSGGKSTSGLTLSGSKVRVLIVEDSAPDAELTRIHLSSSPGWQGEFHVVGTLAEAQDALKQNDVDVVLLDLLLPDSTGLATFERLHAVAPEMPIIVLSGHADEQMALRTVQGGAQDYLPKDQIGAGGLARAVRYAVERQRIEIALERERNLFRTLMDNIPDSVYFKNRQSRFLIISLAQARMFGFKSTEEAVGKSDFDVFTEEHARPAFEDEQTVMRTGEPVVGKVEKETLTDGRLRWALTTKMPFRDRHGRIIGTFGISKDITELKLMEAVLEGERNLLRSVIDALPDHIYVKDDTFRFTLCNLAVAKFFGLPSSDAIVGKTDAELLPSHLAAQFREEEQGLILGTKQVVNREDAFKNHDGRTHWVMTTKVPLHDAQGRVIGLVGINRNISERKWAEEQLQQLNADLASRQKELLSAYEDLKKANAELKTTQLQLIQVEKLESVGRLAAGVAHEVKNPLSTLLMGVEYLGDALTNAPEDVAMTLAQMREAVQRADAIVHGLLDIASSGKLRLADDSLNSALEQSLMLVRHELQQKHIHVFRHLDLTLPHLQMDRQKIEQVFINLIINAIYAMPTDGELRVTTKSIVTADGRQSVLATIEDNGPGISPEALIRIFDPFFSTKPTGMGSGLGLAVARNIMEMHGGKIEITNRPEGGACATVTLCQQQPTTRS